MNRISRGISPPKNAALKMAKETFRELVLMWALICGGQCNRDAAEKAQSPAVRGIVPFERIVS